MSTTFKINWIILLMTLPPTCEKHSGVFPHWTERRIAWWELFSWPRALAWLNPGRSAQWMLLRQTNSMCFTNTLQLVGDWMKQKWQLLLFQHYKYSAHYSTQVQRSKIFGRNRGNPAAVSTRWTITVKAVLQCDHLKLRHVLQNMECFERIDGHPEVIGRSNRFDTGSRWSQSVLSLNHLKLKPPVCFLSGLVRSLQWQISRNLHPCEDGQDTRWKHWPPFRSTTSKQHKKWKANIIKFNITFL